MKNTLRLTALLLSFPARHRQLHQNDSDTNNGGGTACNGLNLCFKLDGALESHNATWKVLSDRYRIYWEESVGAEYKNIEIDIYTTAIGTYNVSSIPGASKATFQYYTNTSSGSRNILGMTGTVSISAINGNKISGNFTVSAKDVLNHSYEITEGHFENVPQ